PLGQGVAGQFDGAEGVYIGAGRYGSAGDGAVPGGLEVDGVVDFMAPAIINLKISELFYAGGDDTEHIVGTVAVGGEGARDINGGAFVDFDENGGGGGAARGGVGGECVTRVLVDGGDRVRDVRIVETG